jgi:peptidyl-prolyl cis-trans isomerase B (cyclophilin B)
MSSKKRSRELARKKYERQQMKRAQNTTKHRTVQQILAVVVVAALVIGSVAFWAFSRPQTAAVEQPVASEITCEDPGALRANDISWPTPPERRDFDNAPALSLQTNCGEIIIQTLPQLAPDTVSSEVFLTESGFYDGTSCHRLTTAGIFVLQCGDPAGDGTGGPGYTVPDENFPNEGPANYPAGTVAMANAGPNTSGSQFFIVYEDTSLPAAYTIWGTVVSGLDIVRAVADQGAEGGASDAAPAQPVVINSATVLTNDPGE